VLITFVSAKGSPGVTTATLALAASWPGMAVVIDVDPAGGDMAAGVGCGSWPPAASLIGLAVEARQTPVEIALRRLVMRPAPHCPPILAGLTTPSQAAALPWPLLIAGFGRINDADLLCDGGRYIAAGGIGTLLQASDQVVVVTRSTLPSVRATARLVPILRDEVVAADCALSVLVVGPDRPYSAQEIADSCGTHLLGELPLDPRAASVWSEGDNPPRAFFRSPLQRAAQHLAEHLATSAASVREVTQ
jgi:MinD-like ATPase involved in chromosome partitioning or flagellar assembly